MSGPRQERLVDAAPRKSRTTPLRLGILGAARIAPFAVLRQAARLPDVDVVAVGEEYHPERYLQRYAKKHRIRRTYRSFDALLDNPEIDTHW